MANNTPIIEHPEIRTMRKDIKRLKGLGKNARKLVKPPAMPEVKPAPTVIRSQTPPQKGPPAPPPVTKIPLVQIPKSPPQQGPPATPPTPPVQKTSPPPSSSSSKMESLEDVKRKILENTQQAQVGTAKPIQETQKLESISSTTVKPDLFTITPKKEAQPEKPVPTPMTPPPPPAKEAAHEGDEPRPEAYGREPKPTPPSHPGKEKIFLRGISSAAREHLKNVAKTEEEKRKRFMEDVESWASSKDEGE